MKPIKIHDKMPEGKTPALSIWDLVQIDPKREDFFRYKYDTIIVCQRNQYIEYPIEIIESDEFDLLTNLKKVNVWK